MIGFAYFLIIWLGVGLLTGIKFIFVDQVYDDEFKELMDKKQQRVWKGIWPACFSKISLTLLLFSC